MKDFEDKSFLYISFFVKNISKQNRQLYRSGGFVLRSHGKPDRSPTSTRKTSGFGDYTINLVINILLGFVINSLSNKILSFIKIQERH